MVTEIPEMETIGDPPNAQKCRAEVDIKFDGLSRGNSSLSGSIANRSE